MKPTNFLSDIQQRIASIEASLQQKLLLLPEAALNHKFTSESWSVLECLEHLNRYGRYYLPALQQALVHPRGAARPEEEVGLSWFGRKSYELVRPENRKAQKTLRRMNPARSHLTPAVLEEFQSQLANLQALLPLMAQANLNQKAVPVEFFRLLKLRVGEALLFVVAHMQRHVQQAERAAAVAQQQLQPA
ncbi:DinB family protein [Hymenobacter fodinae]|uniref:DinB family protein n=1 Tax=Hymenobacter fodinae TaxID=2510796 RepID=A0A4Z0P543_9BACT|nr:DinB family protein [Hymenobacter fodinae]TGE05506.1 DinB family protein [Hymenobacter fodinae]